MALYQVNAGDRILAADINQYYSILKGVAASGETVTLIYNNQALILQPSSDPTAGTRVVIIKNTSGSVLGSWRYDGVIEALAAAAAPASPVTGSLYYDTVLGGLQAYSGSSWQNLSPTTLPNLVLNSDFGRRTVFGLAMPEVFADTSGVTVIDGTLGTVTANVLTAGTNGTWSAKWCGTNATFYRDGRFSFLVKQNGTGTTNVGRIGGGKGDGVGAWTANNGVYAVYFRTGASAVTLELIKVIAGVTTVVASSAGLTWTDGRVGWAELEGQGTTYIAKLYDQGSGTPGVKSSATLLGTATGTIADAGVVSGQPMAVNGSGVGAATVWGGVSTGNGGVYVETWLPESWAITHTGTLGGQAIGYDDAADSGPLNKQWTPVVYIPATSRTMTVQFSGPDGGMQASTAYDFSYYEKNTSLGGSGVMIRGNVLEQNSASGTQATNSQDDAAETSYTRKSATFTTNAATRRFAFQFLINQGGARTGTVRFSLPQVELGSAATAWRNAPADDAPIVWELKKLSDTTTTSASTVEADSRDLAGNLFIPWDASLLIESSGSWFNTAANTIDAALAVDGTYIDGLLAIRDTMTGASVVTTFGFGRRSQVAAGKHRVNLGWRTGGGTATLWGSNAPSNVRVTAYRGK